jgi:AcrR family transcriptional regulator
LARFVAGSTSNHFRTRDALLNAVVERFAARERAAWEDLARRMYPTTPHELAQVLVLAAKEATGKFRTRSPCAHPSMSTPQRVASSASPWS